jgi:hypothetical protein
MPGDEEQGGDVTSHYKCDSGNNWVGTFTASCTITEGGVSVVFSPPSPCTQVTQCELAAASLPPGVIHTPGAATTAAVGDVSAFFKCDADQGWQGTFTASCSISQATTVVTTVPETNPCLGNRSTVILDHLCAPCHSRLIAAQLQPPRAH